MVESKCDFIASPSRVILLCIFIYILHSAASKASSAAWAFFLFQTVLMSPIFNSALVSFVRVAVENKQEVWQQHGFVICRPLPTIPTATDGSARNYRRALNSRSKEIHKKLSFFLLSRTLTNHWGIYLIANDIPWKLHVQFQKQVFFYYKIV